VIKTIDGGMTWQTQNSGINSDLFSICFINSQKGWISGGYPGIIKQTLDGGTTWQNQIIPSAGEISSIYFVDSINGWAVGQNGTIIHTSNGGVTPIHKTIVSSPTFSLYPNPAEESIQLQVKGNIISMNVTDALGRIVETEYALSLPDKRLDIRQMHPGMYWVKIQTTEGMAMQKLVKK
jgi:hypothetical protein